MKKLYLLDAYALIFRAYYAFLRNPRMNSKGFNTSAVFGFLNALLEILEKEKPTHIAVVFDHKSPTFRVKEFPFYKANREETPEDIRAAEPWIRRLIEALHIPILEAEGYEADDVIATLAKKGEEEGFEVFMVTPDKDFMQLLTDRIKMLKPAKGGNPPEIITPQDVMEKYGLSDPKQFIDILALMGDTADNIPGVKGVGEKTAAKLISQYGSIEQLYDHLDEIKGKLKEKLENDKENAFISKKLATIILDVPVAWDPEELTLSPRDDKALKSILEDLEFRSIIRRLFGEGAAQRTPKPGEQLSLFPTGSTGAPVLDKQQFDKTKQNYQCVETPEEIERLVKKLLGATSWAFDTETTGLDTLQDELVGISFSLQPHTGYFIPIPEDRSLATTLLARLKPAFEAESIVKIAHNAKFDIKVLHTAGVETSPPFYDTMIAHFLAQPDRRHKLDILSENYLQYEPIHIESLIGKRGPKQKNMRSIDPEILCTYAAEDADITLRLYPKMEEMVRERQQEHILEDIELPLLPVLAEMEIEGIRLDVDFLKAYSKEIGEEIQHILSSVFRQAGVDFNPDSPSQVGEVLFRRLKIPYEGPKTKTGKFSTREEVLTKLKDKHPIIGDILRYRELAKLKSTYVDALPALVNPTTGRLHTTFSQTIASTGRLSSMNPNIQNIPIRTERGRKIRKAFIPKNKDYVLLAADYSQIELRLLAHMSQDPGMIEAFKHGEDIHRTTAAKVFGVAAEAVTSEMRRKAKAVNFGIAYGQSAFGLAQALGISRTEAKEIIDNYFTKFSGIRDYMDKTIAFAREHGYVETIMGRRRYLRDIHSRNNVVRSAAERNAINSPIQGSAADMIKIAMIAVQKALKQEGFTSKMLLQVHDELVFDVYKEELESLKKLVSQLMENAIPDLLVPIKVDLGTGNNWLEAH